MATIAENAAAVKAAQVAIDAAIVAKGGTTDGGLTNAAAAIASIPSGEEPLPESYDGDATNIYVDLTPDWAPLTAELQVRSQGAKWSVDWGDGTVEQYQRTSGYGYYNMSHLYATRGKYRISMLPDASSYAWEFRGFGNKDGDLSYDDMTYNLFAQSVYMLEFGARRGGYSVGIIGGIVNCRRILCSPSAYFSGSWHSFGIDCKSLEYLSAVSNYGANANNNGPYFGCLKKLIIREGTTECGIRFFERCEILKEVVLPQSLTSISNGLFRYCYRLEKIVIPDAVESIANEAFWQCDSAKEITIGSGVSTIGPHAFAVYYASFRNCSRLVCRAVTPPTLEATNVFENKLTDDVVIYVPASSIEAYEAAPTWSTYAGHFQAITEE